MNVTNRHNYSQWTIFIQSKQTTEVFQELTREGKNKQLKTTKLAAQCALCVSDGGMPESKNEIRGTK